MTNWAATTDQTIDHGFGESRNGSKISGVIIHHGAGTDVLDYVANSNLRNSHPTYHIARNGTVTGIVNPNRRPFSTANGVDEIAVTFELDNERASGEYPITNATMEALIQVIADHGAQSGRKGFAKNIRGKEQSEFFVGYHSQYVNTACPGIYITSNIDWIVGELNRRAGIAGNTPAPAQSAPASAGGTTLTRTDTESDGIPGAIFWARMQLWGKLYGDYTGPIDGEMGENSWAAVQLNLRRESGYTGPVDGVPGANTYKAIQRWASRYGYTGPIDGVPGANTWRAVAKALNTL